jgi:hypothetical protein
MNMKQSEPNDETDGYESGDQCPKCGGLIEIRRIHSPEKNALGLYDIVAEYAQCGKCNWNSRHNS